MVADDTEILAGGHSFSSLPAAIQWQLDWDSMPDSITGARAIRGYSENAAALEDFLQSR